ncbi:MAG: sulfite oxidase heme-binding subunit YedZ [Vicinamibacterales bacterium]
MTLWATIFVAALLPLASLAWRGHQGTLGANPIETLTRETGLWTLRLLLTTLAVTPLRRLLSWNGIIRVRRMLGLFAFFYASLHYLTYLWLDQFFSLGDMIADIGRRPFITVGFAAFILLVPLAATSTAKMMRLLGGRRWRMLHRLSYAAAVLGVFHYWWLVKADIRPPLAYAVALSALLGFRVTWRARQAALSRAKARHGVGGLRWKAPTEQMKPTAASTRSPGSQLR